MTEPNTNTNIIDAAKELKIAVQKVDDEYEDYERMLNTLDTKFDVRQPYTAKHTIADGHAADLVELLRAFVDAVPCYTNCTRHSHSQ